MKISLDDPKVGGLNIPIKIPVGSTITLTNGQTMVLAHPPKNLEERVRAGVLSKLRCAHPEATVIDRPSPPIDEPFQGCDAEIELHIVYRPRSGRRVCPTCRQTQPWGIKLYRPFECVSCGHVMPDVKHPHGPFEEDEDPLLSKLDQLWPWRPSS